MDKHQKKVLVENAVYNGYKFSTGEEIEGKHINICNPESISEIFSKHPEGKRLSMSELRECMAVAMRISTLDVLYGKRVGDMVNLFAEEVPNWSSLCKEDLVGEKGFLYRWVRIVQEEAEYKREKFVIEKETDLPLTGFHKILVGDGVGFVPVSENIEQVKMRLFVATKNLFPLMGRMSIGIRTEDILSNLIDGSILPNGTTVYIRGKLFYLEEDWDDVVKIFQKIVEEKVSERQKRFNKDEEKDKQERLAWWNGTDIKQGFKHRPLNLKIATELGGDQYSRLTQRSRQIRRVVHNRAYPSGHKPTFGAKCKKDFAMHWKLEIWQDTLNTAHNLPLVNGRTLMKLFSHYFDGVSTEKEIKHAKIKLAKATSVLSNPKYFDTETKLFERQQERLRKKVERLTAPLPPALSASMWELYREMEEECTDVKDLKLMEIELESVRRSVERQTITEEDSATTLAQFECIEKENVLLEKLRERERIHKHLYDKEPLGVFYHISNPNVLAKINK